MAKLDYQYNPDEVESGNDFSAFEAGEYVAFIEGSDVADLKSGKGVGLNLKWKLTEGQPNAGRVVFQLINYQHESAQAQLIGQQQLKAICEAVGHSGLLEDSEVLHNVECRVRIGVEQDKEKQYPPKNVIKGVKPLEAGAPVGKPAAASAPASKSAPAGKQAPASGKPAMPWRKSA
jgi:hypothetical protein